MRPNRVVGTVVGMVVEKVGQVTILLRSCFDLAFDLAYPGPFRVTFWWLLEGFRAGQGRAGRA